MFFASPHIAPVHPYSATFLRHTVCDRYFSGRHLRRVEWRGDNYDYLRRFDREKKTSE
jgi:hypothetical protein